MGSDPATRLRDNSTGVTATVVTGLWLALLFLPWGGQLWLPVMLVGYIVVVPLVALLFGDEDARVDWWDDTWVESETTDGGRSQTKGEGDQSANRGAESRRDALETLRERYAAGELTDDQFERKLDRLLETETLEDAEQWVADDRQRNRDPDAPDRDVEYDR